MGAPKKPTHVMVHPKQYMRVNGKIQHVPAGTELTLDDEIAKGMGKKVRKIGDKKSVDLTKEAE